MDKPLEHYAKWKNSDTRGHILYDSICKIYPEQVHLWRQTVDWWLAEAWRGSWGRLHNEYGVSFREMTMFWNLIEVTITQLVTVLNATEL